MKILYINSVCGFGSTGKIVEDLANMEGIESLIIYGRMDSNNPKAYKMTNIFGNCVAAINTILFNKNGLSNKRETLKTIEKIKEFNPDIIHLHNLHGYYINYDILFKFLKEYKKPVIWTLHDCWAFTGYCPCFDYVKCGKYKIECNKGCNYGFAYPYSLKKQNITEQYYLKKELFTSLDNLTLVTPSKWLKNRVSESYLKDVNIEIINNGIDINVFKPSVPKNKEFTILFVSNVWTKQKGLKEIENIVTKLDKTIKVIVVGKLKSTKALRERCVLIERTNNKEELRDLYSQSHLFINPTFEDNYPTVNMESLACGTPVITYNTGGSPETINMKTGIVCKDYFELINSINTEKYYQFDVKECRENAKKYSNKIMIKNYLGLYKRIADL